jgi:hypothetical protein
MKYVIRGVLLVIIAVLAYFTYDSIAEPVRYGKEVAIKEQAVIDKLKIIRDAQLTYRDNHGEFTASFDTLIDFMKNGQIKIMVEFGDRDDSTTVFITKEMFVNVKDSMFPDVDIDNIKYVPFLDKVEFKMQADKITTNNVLVPVFQVEDPEPFNKERREKNNPLRVGSVYEVNYRGNWGSR